ncbi:MAG: hypothetical protein DLM67_05425 [Candidatus Nephthysia bennettiae]|nr:MAG: hypothetical protein DLM67_05425 [Candidatus Dormibacteraeota bacterium]
MFVPPAGSRFGFGFVGALGAALVITLYDYAGYNDAALVGDGNETLNGLAVRHYRFQLRPDALIAGNLAPASGDLWADAETHHYARIILSLTSAAGPPDNNGTLQLDFSDYGTPVTPMQLLLTPAP